MKKLATTLVLFGSLTLAACGSSAEKMLQDGNAAYAEQDYAAALDAYQAAGRSDPHLVEPAYNAANVHYRLGDYEQAEQQLQPVLQQAEAGVSTQGYYNLGNARYSREEYAAAVDAFKEALRRNPQDADAKHNLELALRQQQAQQEEEQQEQQQQDQEQQNQQDQAQQDQAQQNQQEQQQGEQDDQEQQQADQPQDPSQNGSQEQAQQDAAQQDAAQQDAGQPADDGESQVDGGAGQPEENTPGPQAGQDGAAPPQPTPAGDQAEPGQGTPAQPGDQPADGPAAGAVVQAGELSEEQARQLLVAAGQKTETLQEHLQQVYLFPFGSVDKDW